MERSERAYVRVPSSPVLTRSMGIDMEHIVKIPPRFRFILGFVLGALLFGTTAAVAAGIIAQPKTATVIIDGQVVDLKGYVIEGSHYFQLRDLDEKLIPSGKDFSVVWDGANSQVLIDTSRRYDPNETLPNTGQTQIPEQIPDQTTDQISTMTIDEMKAEIVRLTNIERVNAGQSELEVYAALMKTAQEKADDMDDNNYYNHNSPVYGTPGQMIKAAIPSVKSSAENLASWRKTPQEVVSGMMDSPDHRKNMLSPKYDYIGVGIIEGLNGGYWWVIHYAGLYQ
jgi:uncharacterized protein YkwD